MNYLAHIYLSGDNIKLMIGNFIADTVKGLSWENYEIEVQKGIKLHRAIDQFTDTHDIVQKSKSKLRSRYRHYSPVIVDIFYDHFLAKNWSSYHTKPLDEFVGDTYQILQTHSKSFPEKMQFILKHMVKNNWLYHYQYLDGVEGVMRGMSMRTAYESGMEHATEELITFYDEFKLEFETFFPLLRQFVKGKTAELK